MASNTPNLQLYKKDPVADAADVFNIDTMLNENWDKIDAAVGNINIPDASTSEAGKVMLSNAIDGERENVAATEKAVKTVYDSLFQSVSDGKGDLETTITGKGGTVSKAGSVATFDELNAGIQSINTSAYTGKTLTHGTVSYSVQPTGSLTTFTDVVTLASFNKGTSVISGCAETATMYGYTNFRLIPTTSDVYMRLALRDKNGVVWDCGVTTNGQYSIYIHSFLFDIRRGICNLYYFRQSNPSANIASNKPSNFSAEGTIDLIVQAAHNRSAAFSVQVEASSYDVAGA